MTDKPKDERKVETVPPAVPDTSIEVLVDGTLTLVRLDQFEKNYSVAERGAIVFDTAKYEARVGVDAAHATFMRRLTGDASIEERDTWQSKELASHALNAGEATPAQAEMLAIEAGYIGIEPAQLAATIVAKADQFKKLTGLAAGVRGKARAAIEAARTPKALQDAVDAAQADVEGALALLQNG